MSAKWYILYLGTLYSRVECPPPPLYLVPGDSLPCGKVSPDPIHPSFNNNLP